MGNKLTLEADIPSNYIKDDNNIIKYLVFSGGSIKSISYLGVIEQLLDEEMINGKIEGFAGSSAGSIFATLLALGYNLEELRDIFLNLDIKYLCQYKSYIGELSSLICNYGLMNRNHFEEFLGNLIEQKTKKRNYTIRNLYDDKKIVLIITGTNLNEKKTIYFNPFNEDKYSNISILEAIMISTNIPLLFDAYLYNGDYYVDGGLLDNYPIDIFDNEIFINNNDKNDDDNENNNKNENKDIYNNSIYNGSNKNDINHSVLGINLMVKNSKNSIKNLYDYSYSILTTLLVDNKKTDEFRTINVLCDDIKLTEFDINMEEKLTLIEEGKKAVREYIKLLDM